MRAWVIARPGDAPDAMELTDRPPPAPAGGEIRVRVQAFGVNRADILQRRGRYPAPPGAPADIPGLEFAGVVEAVAPDVPGWREGDRVMGITGGGAYAELVCVPASYVTRVPGALSWMDAAAVPEVFVTANDALDRLDAAAGEWVLIHAAGSGVGTAAVQLVRARDAYAIGTSRTPAKLERARALGLEAGIDSTTPDWVDAVRARTGGGAHAALDLVGGALFGGTLEALAPRGRLVLVGLTAGRTAHVDLGVVLRKRLRIEGTVLRSRSRDEKAATMRAFAAKVLPLLEAGRVRPVVDRAFAFADVPAAHAYVESNASFGKVVVAV